jgi:dTDP-4-dehydrorhamnose reductase
MKIAILGAGYIGANLDQLLRAIGHDVSLISHSAMDYHDTAVAARLSKFGCVINAAGFTGRPNIDECETQKDLCWHLNVKVPITITRALAGSKCRLIHIGSGCIYDGYEKEFTETDAPNIGACSSFYSYCKQVFELLATGRADILRIRMPICDQVNYPRNYLSKIANYNRLIDARNSKTYVPDLAGFIAALLQTDQPPSTYNVVNQAAMTTREVIAACGMKEPQWVELSELGLLAHRSNCVLSNAKASKIYRFRDESEIYQTPSIQPLFLT